jgi:endo-1,4-beta-mannosidase
MITVAGALLFVCAGCGGSADGFSDAQPTDGVFVKAHGRNLELGGETFIFRGVNIWGAASDQSVFDCGAEDSDHAAYLDRTFRGLSALGVNVVRFFAFQSYAGGGTDLTPIKRVIDAARRYNIRVIPVLGNQFGNCDYYPSYAKNLSFTKSTVWYETGYMAPNSGYALSYRDYVRMIVGAFKDDPTVLVWQLMNEAQVSDLTDADGAILRGFVTDVSGLIKSIDSNHLVSVGTQGTGQPGTQGPSNRALHEISTVDVVEAHDYDNDADPLPGYPDSRWNTIWGAMTDAVELDKPFFIDEAGITAGDDAACPYTLAARAELLASKARAMFRQGGVGYLYWSYAERINPQDKNCGYDMTLADPALTGLRHILS